MPPHLVHQHEDAERTGEQQRHTVPFVLMIGKVQRRTAPFVKMTGEAQRHTAPFVKMIGEVQTHCILCADDWKSAKCQRHTAPFALSQHKNTRRYHWALLSHPLRSRAKQPRTSCYTSSTLQKYIAQSNHRLHATQAPHSKSTQHKVTTGLHAVRKPEARASGRKEHTTNKYTYWKRHFLPQDIYIYVWQLVLPPVSYTHLTLPTMAVV